MNANILEIQKECCDHYDEELVPVKLDQLVVVSAGVLKGNTPIEGVRYESPDHMSGWWLSDDDYDGNIDSLETVHFLHIIEKRPDLATYMGLPYGYRFLLGAAKDHVWFDNGILDD